MIAMEDNLLGPNAQAQNFVAQEGGNFVIMPNQNPNAPNAANQNPAAGNADL